MTINSRKKRNVKFFQPRCLLLEKILVTLQRLNSFKHTPQWVSWQLLLRH